VASEVQPVLLIAAEPSRDGVVEEFAGSDEQSENHGVCVAEGRDRMPCERKCGRVRESSRCPMEPQALVAARKSYFAGSAPACESALASGTI
jgi:hypothetical protein